MDLLNHDRDKVPKSYLHIVSSTVVHMADAQPELMKMYMMKPLMKTMDICNDSTGDKLTTAHTDKESVHLRINSYQLTGLSLAEK